MAQVTCVQCGELVDETKADITGRGYRCAPCSMRASINANLGANDVGDHLDPAERAAKSKQATMQMVGGATLFVVLTPLFIALPFKRIGLGALAGVGLVIRGYYVRRQMAGHADS